MLKRIDPGEVRLGMFIHKLEGNWFSHPFWRAHFLLTDQDQLDRLHASDVPAVIIDTERGIDPDGAAEFDRAAAPTPDRHPDRAAPGRMRRPGMVNPPPPPPDRNTPDRNTMARVLSAPPAEVGRGFGRANAIADRGLKMVAHVFLEMRLGKSITPAAISPVINSIITSLQTNPFAFNGLMRFRRESEDVYRHALATSALMIALGRHQGLQSGDLHDAGLAGLLLDSGVILLPLDEADRDARPHVWPPEVWPPEVWRRHAQLGHDFILRSRLSNTIARACLEHHERFDGTGWPHGVGGQALSRLGRMAAICDSYDLLATGSAGRAGTDPAEALRAMKADHGAFDPELLSAFEAMVGTWPTGAVVALRGGRLAVVVDQRSDAPDRPLVAVFYDPATARPIDDVWIDLNACYGADAIVGAGSITGLPHDCQDAASAALAAALDRVIPGGKRSGSKAA